MQQQLGSGKTAVLVERIINKVIKDKVDIDKILIVTFTNAAAAEMRERILDAIYKKLDENPDDEDLQRQIVLLNKASICTIHSFCLDVIRNHFYELDIPANFRVADTGEIELLKQDVLEDIFEEKYLNNDKDFLTLINTYTGYRDDETLKELVLSIYRFIQSSPFPMEWLEEKTEMFNIKDKKQDFNKTVWGRILLNYLSDVLQDGIIKLENLVKDMKKYEEIEKYTSVISNDIDNLKALYNSLDSWDKAYKMSNIAWEKWPVDRKISLQIKDEAKKVRDEVKKKMVSEINKIMKYSSEDANTDIADMYDILRKLKNLVGEFNNIFSIRKREKNIIDFNDIEHFALKLLINTDENSNVKSTSIAREYMEKFQEIAIDEYQDSNLVQEYILSSISRGNNIFMVGDVKQSIYKFRQARPELFLEKYEKYSDKLSNNVNNLKIKLFKNFRSRSSVLDYTNLVFENIMSKEAGDILYNEEEYLNLGANFEEPNSEEKNYAGKTEIHIIDLKDEEENQDNTFENSSVEDESDDLVEEQERIIEDNIIEARFIANKIKELIKSGYQVYDKKLGYRNIKYKDIVILLRATTNMAPIYEKELDALEIPVFTDTSSEFLDSIEVQTVLALLKIMDNPMQDIPLVTVLRSAIFSFTDDDLVKIRLTNRNSNFYEALIEAKNNVDEELRIKIEDFLSKLNKWQSQINERALDELIWNIYVETNYYNYVGLMPNGNLRKANLKMLFERAKQYEKASFKGLYNFINFIDKLKASSGDMTSAKLIGENEDVVRIMSIHKSKGLEFPVVFLAGTGKSFNLQDLNDTILMHQDIGFGPKYISFEDRIEYNTLAKEAIRLNAYRETLSEEMRILYVALTRAKEKLIITGMEKDAEKSLREKEKMIELYEGKIKAEKLSPLLVKKYKKYLDWLELVYINNRENKEDICEFVIHNKNEIINNKDSKKEEDSNISKDFIIDLKEKAEIVYNENDAIINKIKWTYKYINSANIPTKTSVTKIKELENENIMNLEESLSKEDEYKLLNKKPKFLNEDEKISNSEKGTLMHLCLQKMNEKEEYNIDKIKELIENLCKKGIITTVQKDAINVNKLYQYTKSNLWNELKMAKEVNKEKPFYINISSKELFEGDTNENILVQGIIDLYYINKNDEVILVDYKTDYVEKDNEQTLIEKYKKQLELYKKALERSLEKKVAHTYIYSVYLNKSLELDI